jgi:hypothetical protein
MPSGRLLGGRVQPIGDGLPAIGGRTSALAMTIDLLPMI